jgi:hypothetical protein
MVSSDRVSYDAMRFLSFLNEQPDHERYWPIVTVATHAGIDTSAHHLNRIVSSLVNSGRIQVSEDDDPFFVRITISGASFVLAHQRDERDKRRILDQQSHQDHGSSDDSSEKHENPEEVISSTEVTDASADEEGEDITAAPISSSAWTGATVSVSNAILLVERLRLVERAIDELDISNADKAQARAYVVAMLALADAPDPPADLLWELVQRASQIAGIAALLISIVALFVR